MNSTYLQIFLLINVFMIGALATIGVQHAYAHFRPAAGSGNDVKLTPTRADKSGHLPPEIKDRLIQASQANFQTVLDRSAAELQHDLKATTQKLDALLQKIGARVIAAEMERYQLQLEHIRKQAETAIGGAQDQIAKHQAELQAELEQQRLQVKAGLDEQQLQAKAKLDEDIAVERQRLLKEILDDRQRLTQQIDAKLSDAVASFLLETLGHNVDLGAQTTYLTALLEEHKTDFKRQVSDEV